MNSSVAPIHSINEAPETSEKARHLAAVRIKFGFWWCLFYFLISGDKNYSLHLPWKRGIVQGMAILTKLGTTVSRLVPGYMVRSIVCEIKFRHAIRIGESITLEAKELEKRGPFTVLEVTLRNGSDFAKAEIRLLPEGRLDQ
jgi:hypothetical protein